MTNKSDNKDKLRVYEYAKNLNMSSKEIITILKRLGLPVNNHMSVMENDAVNSVEKFFHDVKMNAAAKRAGIESGKSGGANANVASKPAPTQTAPAQGQGNASDGNRPAQNQLAPAKPQSSGTQGAGTQTGASQTDGTQQQQNARPQGAQGQGYNRPQGQGQGGNYNGQRQGDRPLGAGRDNRGGQGGQGSYNRPAGQGQGQSGGQGSYNRPAGQGQSSGQGSYNRPAGQGQGGGQGSYNRPAGQGSGQGNYNRPAGQGQGGGQGSYNRPAGQSQGGGQGSYNRPAGQGQGGGQGSYNRPAGQSQGGGQGNYNRPAGQGQGGGQGNFNRPAGQGNFNRPAGQGQGQGSGQRGPQSAPPARGGQTAGRPGKDSGGRDRQFAGKDTGDKKRFGEETDGFGNRKKPGNRKFDSSKGGKHRGRNDAPKIDNTPKKIIVRGTMTVGEAAKALHKDASEVIKKLLFLGIMATINQELDVDSVQLIATEFGVEVELKIPVEEVKFEDVLEKDEDADLLERPPVVTIMGHVDHGKTTLLDAIRHTNVTEGEAGGITQHIGAYQVEVNGKKITFLDTPGHEAFTTMRARGAQVTDIAIIVVAADDGVMPQTVEAIAHAKAANVPIIIAVNKIDKPGADISKIKQSLTEFELVPEEWGGETIFCELSAKQRIGLENLLEMILLVSEVQEFKANPDKRARGTIIEAELDKGRGPVARLLIQHGTLKVGDSFVAGVCFGRVRAMVNDKGKRIKEAGPSTPIEITGLTEVPQAGDPFIVFEDERKARDIAEKRALTLRQSEVRENSRVTLEDLYKHIKEGEIKELNVIIKGDVQGSVEALRGSLEKIEIEGVRVKIILTGAGAITESDIILASASNAIVIGFNVRPEPQAMNTAEQEKVDVRLHRIIYNVIEEIEQAMKGMLDPIFKENIIGHAEVRNVFKITGVGAVAGCMVTQGKILRNAEMRLIRDSIVVLEGKIDTIKRFKDDVKEVAQGYECGITLEKFNDLKEGDIIEAFVMEKVER